MDAEDQPRPPGLAQPAPGAPASSPLEKQYLLQLARVRAQGRLFWDWTALAATAEQLDSIERLREAYDGLLAAYPLCFGYWKKYADAELRHGGAEQATAVYERGVAAAPYCVDLWASYLAHAGTTLATDQPEALDGLHERALAYVGADWNAHAVWDLALRAKRVLSDSRALAALYARVLAVPLRDLERYHREFLAFARDRTAAELLAPEAVQALRNGLQCEAAAAAAAAEGGAAQPPALPDVSDADVQRHWVAQRTAAYQATLEELGRRWHYEEVLVRPFFHPRPLPPHQLAAWSAYLTYAEHHPGGLTEAIRVYERCLIACAAYEDFWARYVRHLDVRGEGARAADALRRGIEVHCPSSVSLRLLAARRLEDAGGVAGARGAYDALDALAAGLAGGGDRGAGPVLAQAAVERANFERRQGDATGAAGVLRGAAERAAAGAQDAAAAALLAAHAALCCGTLGDPASARAAYESALARSPHVLAFWEGAIALEAADRSPGFVGRVLDVYERAARAADAAADGGAGSAEAAAGCASRVGLLAAEREVLVGRAVAFAGTHGSLREVQRAEALRTELFPLPWAVTALGARKRPPPQRPAAEADGGSEPKRPAAPAPAAHTAPAAGYYGAHGGAPYYPPGPYGHGYGYAY